jgi:hypothetical protein
MVRQLNFFSILAVSVLVIFVLSGSACLAQGGTLQQGIDEAKNLASQQGLNGSSTTLKTKLENILSFALGFVGLLGVGALAYAGYLYLTSGGDAKKAATAKQLAIYVVIGLILILLSAVLVNAVIEKFR